MEPTGFCWKCGKWIGDGKHTEAGQLAGTALFCSPKYKQQYEAAQALLAIHSLYMGCVGEDKLRNIKRDFKLLYVPKPWERIEGEPFTEDKVWELLFERLGVRHGD